MATKKEVEAVEVKEEVKVAKPAPKKVEKDPWADMVEIRLPKPLPNEENFVIASVNSRIFKIKKGIPVKVPKPIAEVLEHSLEAEEAAEMYIDKLKG